jgi:hypothetical protein
MRLLVNYPITLFMTAILFFSCRHTSDIQLPLNKEAAWSPNDSLAFYYPQNQRVDLGFQYTKGDTFRENWYSSALFSFREPVLYGHYKKDGMYRFLWLRAFGPPVVFVLTRSGELLTLTTKVLDQQPEFQETKYDPRGWDGLMDELKGKTIERFGDSLLIVKADRRARIVFNQTKRLTADEWTEFEGLLVKAGFWTRAATDDDRGFDGSEWVIERLQKDKYRFVARWSPRGAFRDAGVYLIKLSGLRAEIY